MIQPHYTVPVTMLDSIATYFDPVSNSWKGYNRRLKATKCISKYATSKSF